MKNRYFGFFAISNIHYVELSHRSYGDGGCQLYIIKPHKKSILPYKLKTFFAPGQYVSWSSWDGIARIDLTANFVWMATTC